MKDSSEKMPCGARECTFSPTEISLKVNLFETRDQEQGSTALEGKGKD